MPRGGKREGTPGKAYTNRTDLLSVRAPQTGLATAAAGGVATNPAPMQPLSNPQTPPAPYTTPDMVPRLDDPSSRPDEPVTHGLPVGPGAGVEGLGPIPISATSAGLLAAFTANPTPELRRALLQAKAVGAL